MGLNESSQSNSRADGIIKLQQSLMQWLNYDDGHVESFQLVPQQAEVKMALIKTLILSLFHADN